MKSSLRYGCYFAVLILCIDPGHGRWKTTTRDKLEHDIAAFRRMTEKIQIEIEEFYRKNSEVENGKEYRNGKIERLQEDNSNWKANKNPNEMYEMKSENSIPSFLNLTDDRQSNIKEIHGNYKSDGERGRQDIFWQKEDGKSGNDSNTTDTHWPKFDDILLAIGKRYDWKNDRWIKVKEREKKLTSSSSTVDNIMDFLSKHKFSYRSVKLNRSKSKRNLVVAVSAVR